MVNNPKDTHYAILKPENKIVFGWEYGNIPSEELKADKNYYFFDDMKENGFNPKDIAIWGKSKCIKSGLNPDEDSSWSNGMEYFRSLPENKQAVKKSITESQLKAIIKGMVKKSINEGMSADNPDNEAWMELEDSIGAQEMLDCIFQWSSSDQIHQWIEWFREEGYFDNEDYR